MTLITGVAATHDVRHVAVGIRSSDPGTIINRIWPVGRIITVTAITGVACTPGRSFVDLGCAIVTIAVTLNRITAVLWCTEVQYVEVFGLVDVLGLVIDCDVATRGLTMTLLTTEISTDR